MDGPMRLEELVQPCTQIVYDIGNLWNEDNSGLGMDLHITPCFVNDVEGCDVIRDIRLVDCFLQTFNPVSVVEFYMPPTNLVNMNVYSRVIRTYNEVLSLLIEVDVAFFINFILPTGFCQCLYEKVSRTFLFFHSFVFHHVNC